MVPALGRSWVFHVDMDQFLAAVELLRRPELVGRPVIVGGRGDPTERAVVSTATYEAREAGVRSGMALRIAARKCPEAVFLPVDFPVYEAASAQVMTTLRAIPGAVVEVLGWDEAFVELATNDPDRSAREIRSAVLAATRLHCSIGIGDTTVRAKNATDLGKPQGQFMLTADTWLEVMGHRPVIELWGVGSRTSARLAEHGIHTVEDLAAAPETLLAGEFGPTIGPRIGRLGRGEGPSHVDDTPWVARAHGHETTFQTDLTEPAQITGALRSLAEQVVADLREEERPCQRVHLKVRFAPFFTKNRSRKLPEPTFDAEVIAHTAAGLVARLEDERPVRLRGIRAEMGPPEGGY